MVPTLDPRSLFVLAFFRSRRLFAGVAAPLCAALYFFGPAPPLPGKYPQPYSGDHPQPPPGGGGLGSDGTVGISGGSVGGSGSTIGCVGSPGDAGGMTIGC